MSHKVNTTIYEFTTRLGGQIPPHVSPGGFFDSVPQSAS